MDLRFGSRVDATDPLQHRGARRRPTAAIRGAEQPAMADKALAAISLEAADPTYAKLAQRRRELEVRLSEIRDERIGLIEQLRSEPRIPKLEAPPTDSPIRKAARALLGNLMPVEPAPPPALADGTARARVAELSEEETAINAALAMLAEPLREAKTAATAEVCRRIRPEHDKLAKELASAVLAMSVAAARYRELVDVLDAEGVSHTELASITRLPGGSPRDTLSEVRQWLREAVAAGHLPANALPAAWRERPALLAAE